LEITPRMESDFTVAVTPASSEIRQGDATTFVVRITASEWFDLPVNLSFSGIPAEVTGSFSQTSLSAGGTSTLTLQTSRKTPEGTYEIRISGSSTEGTHDAIIVLSINERPVTVTEIMNEYGLVAAGLLAIIGVALTVLLVRGRKPAGASVRSSVQGKPSAFCISCGSEIQADAEFCPKCGTKRLGH